MYKAVIIDDEPIVLQGIHRMIPWKDMGIQVVGTASDGKEGQMLIQGLKPDLVITDIRMPEMDGIELIKQTAKENPEVLFIIFSGYSEFQYAKEAIAYGVMGYLEKPVDIEELKKIIKRAKEILNDREEKKKLEKQKRKNERCQFLQSLLDKEGSLEDFAQYGLSAYSQAKCYLVVCQFAQEQQLARGTQFLENCVKEIQKKRLREVVVSGTQVILILQTEDFFGTVERIRRRLSVCGYYVRMGSTTEASGLIKISHLYKMAEAAVKYLSFYGMYGLVFYENVKEKAYIQSSDEQEALRRAIQKKEFTDLQKTVKNRLDYMKSLKILPERFRQGCLEILYACVEFMVGEKQTEIREEILKRELPYQRLEICERVEEAEQYTMELLCRMMERYQERVFEEYHYKIRIAVDYIRNHYWEDISLVHLSEITRMNPTYFSALFKKSMGTSYSQYLTKIRMEKAKELLTEGKKVADVCVEVGYYNSRHFSEGFKKYTGMTPKEFRGRLWENPKNTDEI